MAGPTDNLIKGMQVFLSGLNSFSKANRIDQFKTEMNDLRDKYNNGEDVKSQMMENVRNMQADLITLGVGPTSIQQLQQSALEGVEVKSAKSIDEAYMMLSDPNLDPKQRGELLKQVSTLKELEYRDLEKREKVKNKEELRHKKELKDMGLLKDPNKTSLKPLEKGFVDDFNKEMNTAGVAGFLISEVQSEDGFVGPVNNLLNKGRFRNTFDPRYGSFKTAYDQWFQVDYRKAVTGAQASERELTVLKSNIPDLGDTREVFLKKFETFIKIRKVQAARSLINAGKAGRDISKFQGDLTRAKKLAEELNIPFEISQDRSKTIEKNQQTIERTRNPGKKVWKKKSRGRFLTKKR